MFRLINVTLVTILIIICNAASFPYNASNQERIVGGEPAEITEVPYIVALLYDNLGVGRYSLTCGGSILKDTVVITAAHCIKDSRVNRWRVRAGSSLAEEDGQLLTVSSYVINNAFNEFLDYDIGLIFLSSPIELDGINTNTIPLPQSNLVVEDDATVFIAGWGSLQDGGPISDRLRKVTLNVVNQQQCRQIYFDYNPVTSRMICAAQMAGGQGVCHGDSGGPMVKDGILIGLTSWGKGCGVAGQPAIWTRVSEMLSWIDSNMP